MSNPRATLEARLATLTQRGARLEEHRRDLAPADSEEQALAAESDEVVDALDDAGRREIAQIHAALARVAAGTYGLCEVCGEPIPTARLAALPTSTRCLDHADGG